MTAHLANLRLARLATCAGLVIAALMLGISAVNLVGQEPASAAPAGTPPAGPLTMTPATGDSSTNYQLQPAMGNNPSAAFCPGDSATDNYRWQTFITPATIDPATLVYDSNGPVPQAGEATWPLFDTSSSAVVAQTTGVGDGLISTFAMTFSVFDTEGTLPDGDYKIGIACTLTGVTQTYWVLPITLSPGAAIINYEPTTGDPPASPVATDPLTAGDGTLTVAFTPGAADPEATSFAAVATPAGGGTPVVKTGTGSPITIEGLTNGTEYAVTVTATNDIGTSDPSNAVLGTPLAATVDSSSSSSSSVPVESSTTVPESSSTTSTVATSSSTTTPPSGNTTSTVATGGQLPRTGSSSTWPIVIWGVLLLAFGRIAVLLARKPKVLPPS